MRDRPLAALLALLLACRRDDPKRYTALMERNEALLKTLQPSTPPGPARAALREIVSNLEQASRLDPPRPKPGLPGQFSIALEALRPLPDQPYSPVILERFSFQCLQCHSRFKE